MKTKVKRYRKEVIIMPQVVVIGLIGLAGRAIAIAIKKSKKK